jgi:hypothetical protein
MRRRGNLLQKGMQNITNNKSFLRLESWLSNHVDLVAFCIVIFGFFVYIHYAAGYYLNPDEASHFVFANRETLLDAYLGSRSLAHPPLAIMVLHLFLKLGKSVLMLRLLSALFCIAAAWLFFKWIKRVYGSVEAITGLVLLTFSPAMISAASEVRQYALLLFFICGALYFMQRFLEHKSLWFGCLYSVFLYGAILTHYSAIWITLTFAIYVTILFWLENPGRRVWVFWCLSQVCVFVLYVLLYITHIRWMMNSGFAQNQIYGYLKSMYFFPGEKTLTVFIFRSFFDFFTYMTGGKYAGGIAMICFLLGIASVFRKHTSGTPHQDRRYDMFLLIFPFVAGCTGAITRIMPFGGSRHSIYLLPFAITLIALCVVRLFSLKRISFVIMVAALLLPMWLSSLHIPNAEPGMSDLHMQAALKQMNEKVPADSILFVDDMTYYVLGYYLARDRSFLKGISHENTSEYRMGKYRIQSARSFAFSPENFDCELATISRLSDIASGDSVWIITVGWGGGSMKFNDFLSNYSPGRIRERQNFGPITLFQTSIR